MLSTLKYVMHTNVPAPKFYVSGEPIPNIPVDVITVDAYGCTTLSFDSYETLEAQLLSGVTAYGVRPWVNKLTKRPFPLRDFTLGRLWRDRAMHNWLQSLLTHARESGELYYNLAQHAVRDQAPE
jgi:hypothetical protein